MSHAHHHHGRNAANRRRVALALLLAVAYMVAEIVGGLLAGSLALLADAGHMLSDAAALALSLFALWIADRPPTSKRTYGYYRAEILAALVNGAALVAVSMLIFIEAWRRLHDPPPVAGELVTGVATGGLVVNGLMLWILGSGREHSLNVRGAWLHVLSDALGSVGAIAAGVLIWLFAWNWIDPAVSVLVGLLVILSSWRLLAESISVLMESAPRGIDVDEVLRTMQETAGILAVHDLHVWTITTGMDALSAHVVVIKDQAAAPLLAELRRVLHDRFGIDHLTIQIEPEGFEECSTRC